MHIRFPVRWSALLLFGVLSGCGPRLHEISGTVTLDDKPVPTGDIKFLPEDPQFGGEPGKIVDGKYHATLRDGEYSVEIRAVRPVPGKIDPMGTGREVKEDYIPKRYNDNSDLSIVVGDGKTDFPFALKSSP